MKEITEPNLNYHYSILCCDKSGKVCSNGLHIFSRYSFCCLAYLIILVTNHCCKVKHAAQSQKLFLLILWAGLSGF